MKPLVSVIIPSYNHALFITKTIESIVNQTYGYDRIELIVYDDASTDNSLEILKHLAVKYNFKLYRNKKNEGITSVLNFTIQRIKGKYVCITGSDDVWMLDKLDKQVTYMQTHKQVAVSSGNALRIDHQDTLLPISKQIFSPSRSYSFEHIFLRDFPFVSTNAIIRRQVLLETGGYDEDLKIEDYYMWLKIAAAGYEIHMLNKVLGYYRIHPNNTINKSMLIYTEMRKIIDDYVNHPLYLIARHKLDKVYFPQLAKQHKSKALQLLPKAISNSRFFYRGLFWLLVPNFLAILNR
ncbi:MAG: glycosyltransferase [Aureispira sp.]|nr:glycosyltransferase [Aureispira sp.]